MNKEDRLYIGRKNKRTSGAKGQVRVVQIKLKIDQILKKDIHLLKNRRTSSISHTQLEITASNHLLNNYISNNYEQYQIIDPLPNLSKQQNSTQPYTQPKNIQKRLQHYSSKSKKHHQSDLSKGATATATKTKGRINTEPNQLDQKYNPTRLKTQGAQKSQNRVTKPIIHLRRCSKGSKQLQELYKLQGQDVKIYQTGHKYTSSQLLIKQNDTHLDKIKLLESWYVKQKPSGVSAEQKLQPLVQLAFQNIKISEYKTSSEQKDLQVISQRYRYCIGCDRPLLQANIHYHQSICQDFKRVFLFDLNQLNVFLSLKLQRIQQKMKKDISNSQNADSNLRQSCTTLVEACQKSRKIGCRNSEFVEKHKQLCSQFSDRVQLLQSISKLNWFFRLKENIVKKIAI